MSVNFPMPKVYVNHRLRILSMATKPLASNGKFYSTIDAAVDALTTGGWVYVPPGTWPGVVTVGYNDITVFGAGNSSIIDGGTTGTAFRINGNHCVVRDLQVKTTPGQGFNWDGLYLSGDYASAINVFINGTDRYGIATYGNIKTRILWCIIHNSDTEGIHSSNPGSILLGNRILNSLTYGISCTGSSDNAILIGNFIDTTGNDGVLIDANCENCVIDGNRITNWTNEAIDDNSGTSTVGDNDTT